MVSKKQELLLTTSIVCVFLNRLFVRQRRYEPLRHEQAYEIWGPGRTRPQVFDITVLKVPSDSSEPEVEIMQGPAHQPRFGVGHDDDDINTMFNDR